MKAKYYPCSATGSPAVMTLLAAQARCRSDTKSLLRSALRENEQHIMPFYEVNGVGYEYDEVSGGFSKIRENERIYRTRFQYEADYLTERENAELETANYGDW